ncbi:MAG: glycosyltransferase, partial [Bacteroidales bacterium]
VKDVLINIKNSLHLSNVYFYDLVSKNEMPSVINAIDVAVIPLRRLDLFKGAIPSKIFEILAMKKPILLGVEGEAKELFIKNGKCGLSFVPEDADDLSNQIVKLYNSPDILKIMGVNGFEYVKENFSRDKIAEEFWEQLL